jgi:hypothetical protein
LSDCGPQGYTSASNGGMGFRIHWVFDEEQATMATAHHSSVDQIGDTAGLIWHNLNEQGPRTLSQLAKDLDAPRDVVLQGVGWLAREGKISIEEEARGRKLVVLRS